MTENPKLRLLVVDDNSDTITLYQAIFGRDTALPEEQFEVITAQSVDEAEQIMTDPDFRSLDACIVDVQMGARDGYDLIKTLIAISKVTTFAFPAIFVISARVDRMVETELEAEGLTPHIAQHFAKGFDILKVKDAVTSAAIQNRENRSAQA